MRGGRKSGCWTLGAPSERNKAIIGFIIEHNPSGFSLRSAGSPYSCLTSESAPGRQFAERCPAGTRTGGSEQSGMASRILGPHAHWWMMPPAPSAACKRVCLNLCKTQKKEKQKDNPAITQNRELK